MTLENILSDGKGAVQGEDAAIRSAAIRKANEKHVAPQAPPTLQNRVQELLLEHQLVSFSLIFH